MGSSMWIDRRSIPQRPCTEVVSEFLGIISGLGLTVKLENDHTLYCWKRDISQGIRVYAGTAEEDDWPEPYGMHYREIFFDAVYDDEEHYNTDLLLAITAAYMQMYPDALLMGGECSPYLYYDKQDIDAVAASPFCVEWHCTTVSHKAPLEKDLYGR